MTKSDISDFWRWFASVSGAFGARFENADLLRELDKRVIALGPFTWEVGPARDANKNVLVISPGGRSELLPDTKKIIDLAPACPGWQFLHAKPRKEWNRRFFMNDAHGNRVDVDASEWQYMLYGYPDGVFEIVINAPDVASLEADDRITAAEIVLDGELGEEARLSLIDGIEVVVAPDDSVKTIPIANLNDHLQRLTKALRDESPHKG